MEGAYRDKVIRFDRADESPLTANLADILIASFNLSTASIMSTSARYNLADNLRALLDFSTMSITSTLVAGRPINRASKEAERGAAGLSHELEGISATECEKCVLRRNQTPIFKTEH